MRECGRSDHGNSKSLSIQADQIMSPVGGGRFIRGFLAALFTDAATLAKFDRIYIIATQNEDVECLGTLPPNVTFVKRRFPVRLRHTPLARLFASFLPSVDIAYGSFYHVFPSPARAKVITIHDLSSFNPEFHPPAKANAAARRLTRMAYACDGVVCSSDTTLRDFQSRWPELAHKAVRIYCGVSTSDVVPQPLSSARDRSILAVGTIEPRKNYPTLLDAFECLVGEQGSAAPVLTVVGNMGWMSESVGQRLAALEAAGKCRWLRAASDAELADAYARASVFTYLSLSEGFGYPPFEASVARSPMVLSKASSVGEIWAGHARCVDPLDVNAIITSWKWAMTLSAAERNAVVARQEARAREFTWRRALIEYAEFWDQLVNDNDAR